MNGKLAALKQSDSNLDVFRQEMKKNQGQPLPDKHVESPGMEEDRGCGGIPLRVWLTFNDIGSRAEYAAQAK